MDTGPRSLPDVLRATAMRVPDRVAVVGDRLTLTYRELHACVNRLAADFLASGLRPGDLVGLGVERGVLPLILSAAVMRAGCAYVPLDIRHPQARLRHIVDAAGLRVVVCDAAGEAALRVLPVSPLLVDLDDVEAAAAGRPPSPPGPGPAPDGSAYVMFTSGSSGVPKGVPITHANVVALLDDALPLFGYADDEVWPLIHGYGFDVSVWEMWAGIAVGARLVAIDGATAAGASWLAETLVRYRPTRLHIVPSVFRHLTAAMAAGSIELRPRSVVFCGEAVDCHAIQAWAEVVPGPQPAWINVYGITETTVYNTFHTLTQREIHAPAGAMPIGHAYARSPIAVLDDDLRQVPAGTAGEIFIGGLQLSPGYLGNPGLTAQRFLRPGTLPGRWYRTGDLGFVGGDGVVHYQGRADDQVKIRGLRIELGEIDTALRGIPWLRDGAAVVGRSPRGEPAITACVVPASADTPTLGRIRTALAQHIPDYMLPSSVLVLDRLPQNANGKTDRLALGAMTDTAAPAGAAR